MGAIKGLGQSISEAISKERERSGDYQNIFDFCSRLSSEKISKRTIEALITSGAFDCFEETRATLFKSIDISQENKLSFKRNLLGGTGIVWETQLFKNIEIYLWKIHFHPQKEL